MSKDIKPEFFVGLGSQRCGTTLMYNLLKKHSNVFMHPVKELQYFNRLAHNHDVTKKPFLLKKIKHIVWQLGRDMSEDQRIENEDKLKRLHAGNLYELNYHDLFDPYLEKNIKSSIFGEITPDYMTMAEPKCRRMMESIGTSARALLICRHPVDRFISAISLAKSSPRFKESSFNPSALVMNWISQSALFARYQKRLSDYRTAIETFSPYLKRLCIVRYEDLVSTPESILTKISTDLDIEIDIDKAAEETRNNVYNSFGSVVLNDEAYSTLSLFLDDEVQFYNEFFHGAFPAPKRNLKIVQTTRKPQEAGGVWFSHEKPERYHFDNYQYFNFDGSPSEKVCADIDMPERGCLALKDAYVRHLGILINKDLELVEDIGWYMGAVPQDMDVLMKKQRVREAITDERRVSGRSLYIDSNGSRGNFYHYIRESISKMYMVEPATGIKINEFDHILVNDKPNNPVLQDLLFRSLGVEQSKIMPVIGTLVCDEVYTPIANGKRFYSRRGSFQFMRQALGCSDEPPTKRIYLSREGCGRDIQNKEGFYSLLNEYGFEVVECSKLQNPGPTFSSAKIVLGVHGAALANVMFCQRGSSVIELCPIPHKLPMYMSMADASQMRYYGLHCRHKKIEERIGSVNKGEVIVNIPSLRMVLNKVIEDGNNADNTNG